MDRIYKLIDPRNNEIKYIGFTKKKLSRRLKAHIRDSIKNDRTYKQKWIKSLLDMGLIPEIRIVKCIPIKSLKTWEQWEMYYIQLYKEQGFKLTNGTLGGDGVKATKETREKISIALKGKKPNNETREKMRLAKLGKIGKDCPNSKGLIAYNDKEELFFFSAQEAENHFKSKGLKANKKNIGQCLRGKPYGNRTHIRTSVAGYKFKKYEKQNNADRRE